MIDKNKEKSPLADAVEDFDAPDLPESAKTPLTASEELAELNAQHEEMEKTGLTKDVEPKSEPDNLDDLLNVEDDFDDELLNGEEIDPEDDNVIDVGDVDLDSLLADDEEDVFSPAQSQSDDLNTEIPDELVSDNLVEDLSEESDDIFDDLGVDDIQDSNIEQETLIDEENDPIDDFELIEESETDSADDADSADGTDSLDGTDSIHEEASDPFDDLGLGEDYDIDDADADSDDETATQKPTVEPDADKAVLPEDTDDAFNEFGFEDEPELDHDLQEESGDAFEELGLGDEFEDDTEISEGSDDTSSKNEDLDDLLSGFGEPDLETKKIDTDVDTEVDDIIDAHEHEDDDEGLDGFDELDPGWLNEEEVPSTPYNQPKIQNEEDLSEVLDAVLPVANKIEKEESVVTKEESSTKEKKKKSGALTVVALVIAMPIMGALGSFGYDTLGPKFIPGMSQPSSYSQTDNSEVERIQADLRALKNDVSKIAEDNQRMSDVVMDPSVLAELKSMQSQLAQEQKRQLSLFENLKTDVAKKGEDAKQYELDMISRLETMLKFTKGVAEQQSMQEIKIKETVLREALTLLERRSVGSNDQYAALAEEMRKSLIAIDQLESAMSSQKVHLALVSGETDYVKTRVAEVEKEIQKVSSEARRITSEVGKQSVFVNNTQQTESAVITYHVVSVLERGNGEYDIYMQASNAKRSTDFEAFFLNRRGSSEVPGYGRITAVTKVENGKYRVPYIITTEKGDIRGKIAE